MHDTNLIEIEALENGFILRSRRAPGTQITRKMYLLDNAAELEADIHAAMDAARDHRSWTLSPSTRAQLERRA